MYSNWSYSPEVLISGRNWRNFVPCDLEIWWMALENNRAPLLYYIKLYASFLIHRWGRTWVTVRKRLIWVKIGDFLSRVTLKFDGWPWETIGHVFYTALSFMHHFKAMDEFKLELQSGNTQPWNSTDDLEKQQGTSPMLLQALWIISYPSAYSNWSSSPGTRNLVQNRRFL